MRICMVGCGKLGLPVALAMVERGHVVYGYDKNPETVARYLAGKSGLYEPNVDMALQAAMAAHKLHITGDIKEAVRWSEIVFVAVPTPSREDDSFETGIVASALADVANAIQHWRRTDYGQYRAIGIISTVLAGTCRAEFLPVLANILGDPKDWGLVYTPQFIAMGTTVQDYLMPEFWLVGEFHSRAGDQMASFYKSIQRAAPVLRMSPESAEMVKVIYNVMIGLKILYANTIMEMCAFVPGSDADVVTNALKMANNRLISTRYLSPGLGDGGPCHPRDQRALAWQADQFGLSANVFRFISDTREAQSQWLAGQVVRQAGAFGLPIAILGLTFKPETNLVVDSPAVLLKNHIHEITGVEPWCYDPLLVTRPLPEQPFCYVLAMRHHNLLSYPFCEGSIIVDPWGMLRQAPRGCHVFQPGRSK